jgi:quercetin dioxygenase-like cupin family protein
MLEVHVKRGVFSQMHVHAHESFVYVVSGRLKTVIGEQVLELGRGDSCRYPQNVMHSVEALEDTVFLETKAPVPNLQAVLGT